MPHAWCAAGSTTPPLYFIILYSIQVRGWLDYLAFALSGLDARGTLGAAVAYTLGDLYAPGATLDYPRGGSGIKYKV